MSANRWFVLMIAVALAVAAALVVREGIATRASAAASGRLDDYYQRHPQMRIPVSVQQKDLAGSDYFERHWAELESSRGLDTTDYAARHPGLSGSSERQADLTDYAARHPGLSLPSARPGDMTDYYFRHPELSQH